MMSDKLKKPDASLRGGLAAVGFGALPVVCCAGAPLIVGVLGGVALGSVLGVGVGVLAVILVTVLVIVRGPRAGAILAPRVETRGDGGA